MVLPLIAAGARVAGTRLLSGTAARASSGRAGAAARGSGGTVRTGAQQRPGLIRDVRPWQRSQGGLNTPSSAESATQQESGEAKEAPTMPTTRLWLMIGTAVVFDLLQIGILIFFFSPAISFGVLNTMATSGMCESVLHLGTAVCSLIASGTGVVAGTTIAALDAFSLGSLTVLSNNIGQIFALCVSFAGMTLFGFWFFIAGVRFTTGKYALKRFGALAAQWIVELVPFLGALPSLTISVAYMCILCRREDAEKNNQ